MIKTDFREVATVILSGMVGTLFVLPLTSNQNTNPAIYILLGLSAGLLVGFKRRKSTPFFYFAIFAVATLSTIVYFNL